MGACYKQNSQEINEVLNVVKDKSPDIINEAVLKDKALDTIKAKLLKERNQKLEQSIANNSSPENIKTMLKEYNLKELDIERDYFKNEIDKIYDFYELGLDLAKPAKDSTVKQLKKTSFSPCLVSTVTSKINSYTPKQFLHSEFGLPLKTALEKQGMSKSFLEDKKKQLLQDRQTRRQEEKTKYNLVQNEFSPDDDLNLDTDEIYKDIFTDYAKLNEKFRYASLGADMIKNIKTIKNKEE